MDKLTQRLDAAHRVLREVFKCDNFRPFQRQCLENILAKKNLFAVTATGGGKSLLFQLPGLIFPGTVIVISPLIALMADQVQKLRRLGIKACRLSSDLVRSEVVDLNRLSEYEIVYVSPEKLATPAFTKAAARCKVSMIALDEAHVAVTWGKDFRPSYTHIARFVAMHPSAVRFACTATADRNAETAIARVMGMTNYERVVTPPTRPNFTYQAVFDPPIDTMAAVVRDHTRGPVDAAVVYVATRRAAEEVAEQLDERGVTSCAAYHAGLERVTRASVQDRFMRGDLKCVVATNAFGMGVDKSSIRLVYHWHMPGTIFDLAQEAGRGGRDGLPTWHYLNVSKEGRRKRGFFNLLANPEMWVYERLWDAITQRGKVAAGEVSRVTREYLAKRLNLKDGISGMMDSALSYLEFTGHIEWSPGPRVYRLPVRSMAMCREYAQRYRCVRVAANVVTVTTDPDEDDPVDQMVEDGAVVRKPPEEVGLVKVRRPALAVTAGDLAAKRQDADRSLRQVEDFAEAKDKAAFLDSVFMGST